MIIIATLKCIYANALLMFVRMPSRRGMARGGFVHMFVLKSALRHEKGSLYGAAITGAMGKYQSGMCN